MSPPAPQTEQAALIEAGLKLLAQGCKPAELPLQDLSAVAGLSAQVFERCYATPADFQLALFQRLLDDSRAAATQAADQPDGLMSLKRGVEAYLDSHLRHPAVRELTLLLRDREAGQAIINRRIAGFHRVLQVGLSALRSLYPLAGAQLLTAMVIETSQAEYEAQAALPEMRETLYAYLDRLGP